MAALACPDARASRWRTDLVLVVDKVNFRALNALHLIFQQLQFENVGVEKVVQLLVGNIDAQLLKAGGVGRDVGGAKGEAG